MSRHHQTVNRLTIAVLENMSDAELTAATEGFEIDWSGFTDREVEAIRNEQASPELLARVKNTLKPKATTP